MLRKQCTLETTVGTDGAMKTPGTSVLVIEAGSAAEGVAESGVGGEASLW